MDNENNRHPLLKILLLDIGVVGTSIFGAFGIIIIAFILLNYFNIPYSAIYPSPTISPKTSSIKTIVNHWIIKPIQKSITDYTEELHIINTETKEDRLLGKIDVYGTNKNAIFSPDYSQVIFVDDSNYSDRLSTAITVYSILEDKVVTKLTLSDIKKSLPSLVIPRNASLSYLAISPNGQKIAASYGYILESDYNSDIIVYGIGKNKVISPNAKGIVKGWKDDITLLYETPELTKPKPPNSLYYEKVIKEIKID